MKTAGAVRYLSKSASLDALLAAIREPAGEGAGEDEPVDGAAPAGTENPPDAAGRE